MSEKLKNLLLKKGQTRSLKRLVLAAADEKNALEATIQARQNNVIDLTLVGNETKIRYLAKESGFDLAGIQILHEPNVSLCAEVSVKLISEGKADILMKGNLSTSVLLKAVLNKEWGLRSGSLLSHLALFDIPKYHKIIGLTDAAMNIAPDLQEKSKIIENSVGYLNRVGIERPLVAILSAVETVNPSMESTLTASALSKMGSRNQIKNCIIDGPLALDNAISTESARIKNIDSPVAGNADLLVGDDLEASNAIYKSLIYFGQASCAAVIVGAKAPIVLTSRADSDQTKQNSIMLAAAY